jgi:sugar/nucleoside kinase (ribokinase family)
LYGAIAAAKLGKKVAAQLKLAPADHKDLEAFTANGVDVFPIDAKETTYVKVIHKSTNMDDRTIITKRFAGIFEVAEVRNIGARHLHLAGCNDHEFTLAFIKAIKKPGQTLSVDMQSFIRFNDPKTGEISFKSDPQAREAIALMDKVKLDITEARLLTGTENLEKAAEILTGWGCPEIMITQSEGVFVRCQGKNYYEKFSNRSTIGRTGRGDTTFGSYLAWRVDHEPAEAAKIAAALVSLKMEKPGPFSGSLADVLARIEHAHRRAS